MPMLGGAACPSGVRVLPAGLARVVARMGVGVQLAVAHRGAAGAMKPEFISL